MADELAYLQEDPVMASTGAQRARRATADELAETYRLGGEIFAALGEDKAARESFLRWVVLQPGERLPQGTSPKILARFEQARAEASKLEPLSLRHRAERTDDGVRVELVVEAGETRTPSKHMELVQGVVACWLHRRLESAFGGRLWW